MIIENLKDFEILTPDGFKSFDGLLFKVKPRLEFIFNNHNQSIIVSEDHLFNYDDSEYNLKLATELIVGDWISHQDIGFIQIKEINKLPEDDVVDILHVDSKSHIYIGNGLKHHNCSFVGSSKTIVSGDCLEDLAKSVEEPIDFKYNKMLKIYQHPEPNVQYVLGIDPAEGLGQDFSAVQVLKICAETNSRAIVNSDMKDQYKLEQVATYKSNRIKPKEFAQACIGIARYYNMAFMMIENNNSAGGLVCHHVWVDYEYENLVNPTKTQNGKLGINSNSKSKYDANMKMADMLEKHLIKIIDADTVNEINTYEEVSPKRFAACYSSAHDDMVTSLMWGIWFIETKFFEGYGQDQGGDISHEFYIDPPSFINESRHSSNSRSSGNANIGDFMQNMGNMRRQNNSQQGRWF